jgi:ATP-dependent RNA helicase DeaD
VQPGNIVGALAHEGDLHGSEINGIDIRDDHSFVRLPAAIPEHVLKHLAEVVVRGQRLDIRLVKANKGPGKKRR